MNKQRIIKSSQKGFTLMEMLIVVTIIGILSSIVLPRMINSSTNARSNAEQAELQNINAQIELYFFNEESYPSAMTETGWGGSSTATEYWPDGVPVTSSTGLTFEINANNRAEAN